MIANPGNKIVLLSGASCAIQEAFYDLFIKIMDWQTKLRQQKEGQRWLVILYIFQQKNFSQQFSALFAVKHAV